jgi:predicted amidohydrolase YtcJ
VPEAVAVKNGLIVFVGGQARAKAEWQGPDTQWRDLQGGALLPGFIDAHGHVIGTGLQATIANLLADPDGEVTSIESLQEKLCAFARSEVGQRSEWILGFGYDDSTLAERRHPTRDDLDAVSIDKPVLAIHQSFHLGAVNSKGLELLNYTTDTTDPEGGVIRRRTLERGTASGPSYGDPDGVLEETAFTPASNMAIAGMSMTDSAQFLAKGLLSAASFGFTTVQEGAASLDVLNLMRKMANAYPDGLATDVVVYVLAAAAMESLTRSGQAANTPTGCARQGEAGPRRLAPGTYRLAHQALHRGARGPGQNYCGYQTLTDEVALAQVRAGFAHSWQVIAHANGDAAIDQLIRSVRTATDEAGPADRRTTAIHCQTARATRSKPPGSSTLPNHPLVLLHAHLLLGRLVLRHRARSFTRRRYLTGAVGSRPWHGLHLASRRSRRAAQLDRHPVQPGAGVSASAICGRPRPNRKSLGAHQRRRH